MEPPRIASRTTAFISPSNPEKHQQRALHTRNNLKHRLLSRPRPTSLSFDVQRESTSSTRGSPAIYKISPQTQTSANELELEVARALNGMKHNTVSATSISYSPSALYQTVVNPATYILATNGLQEDGQIRLLVQSSEKWKYLKRNSSFRLPIYSSGNPCSVHISDSAVEGLPRHSRRENSQCCDCCSKSNTKLPFRNFDTKQDESVRWNGGRAVKRRRGEEWRGEYWQSYGEDEGKESVKNETLNKGEK